MARTTKLTPELGKRLCDEVSRGASHEAAAALAAIEESTLYRWLEWGKNGKQPYADFARDFARARGEDEAELIKVVRRHCITDWRAAQWLLSVKWPQRYGNLVKHELKFAGMSDAELDAYIAGAEQPALAPGESGGGAAPPGAGSSDTPD